ncbi:MAG: LacI family DNA-binding transcriptional regulator [Paucibacter sp.]|nr:LacI family DNA-binding transcriptional regulator [Roseateles sp.]
MSTKKTSPPIQHQGAPVHEPLPRTRYKSGNPTIRDVAKLAGVAPITASRALSTPNAVSDLVRQRVRDAVAQIGYVPNLLAGALASRKSRLVAAVVPDISGPVFLETIESLTNTLALNGYQLMLGQSGYENSREDALLEAIIGRRPDGIILTGAMRSDQAKHKLKASGIPVVETWDLTDSPIDMLVGFSHEQIGKAVAQFLHAKGRRKLATISGNDDRSRRRARAFIQSAESLGLGQTNGVVPACYVPAPTTLASGRAGLRELLAAAPDIDAIFCSSDLMALGVLIEAQVRRIPIPSDIALIGFGDLSFSRDLEPALTSVRVDGALIGRTAAEFIVQRSERQSVHEPICNVGFSIVERATT